MTRTNGKVLINFEVTPEQRDRIRENAAWLGLPVATFVRRAALGESMDLGDARRRLRERRTGA